MKTYCEHCNKELQNDERILCERCCETLGAIHEDDLCRPENSGDGEDSYDSEY